MDKKLALDTEILMSTFGLKRNHGCLILDELLKTNVKADDPTMQAMEVHRLRLIEEGDFWNEEELKMQFLAFLFFHIGINEANKIKIFYERALKTKVEGKTISVICDCMLAKPFGVNRPDTPYFFLQEAPTQPSPKGKEQKRNDDAEGQMLGAMLIAKTMNGNKKPVYGAFLQGRNWVFATLHGKDYCVSEQFDATKIEQFGQIIGILRNLKKIIIAELL